VTWSHIVKLHGLNRGPITVRLDADADARGEIARRLDLKSLPSLTADITVKPWFDGVEITGRLNAVVEQVCGVSLETFEQPVASDFDIRAVPAGSPHGAEPAGGEMELDPDAPDAPDVLEGDELDVAAHVVEQLALEIDPFPRKPGAEFDYRAPEVETSPFAALKKLADPKA
jgi:hypothetical protein